MQIPMGVPYFQVKDTLRQAGTTVFSSHFALYRDISRRVFSVMREQLEEVEQYSVDEAFFRIRAEDPTAIAWSVKAVVEQQVGIPVSLGLAATKTQAKFANDCAKRSDGVAVFSEAQWQNRMGQIAIKDIWGVGGRMEVRYTRHGLNTVADLVVADQGRIARLFGVQGLRLQQELAGVPVHDVSPLREPQKSIMSSRSFRDTTTDREVVADALAYHVRHAAADLRAMGMRATTLRISIRPSRHGDFLLRGGSAEAVFTVPTSDTFAFLRETERLLDGLFEPNVPYKKAGVHLAGFSPVEQEQASLFAAPERADTKALLATIDTINTGHQRELVLFGSRLKTEQWQSRVDARSPAYTTRWSDVARVRA